MVVHQLVKLKQVTLALEDASQHLIFAPGSAAMDSEIPERHATITIMSMVTAVHLLAR